jgi:predicted acylesterase/phospholipase RssA
MKNLFSLIFQSAKLGDLGEIQKEITLAKSILENGEFPRRIYGLSGGSLSALAYALALSARVDPSNWGSAVLALADFQSFLETSQPDQIRNLNLNPIFGIYNLNPLRKWLSHYLEKISNRGDLRFSDLPVDFYVCAMNQEGILTLFGPPDEGLTCQYHFVKIIPPEDAPIVDAVIASLSTLLSTNPSMVNGKWYKDCRPAYSDAGAIIADVEASDPAVIERTSPHTPVRTWKVNWITSSFIMHSHNEQNQHFLVNYYLDLLGRQRKLESKILELPQSHITPESPSPYHIHLPYIGSTEAFTNMRQSVENKAVLLQRFEDLLDGQLDQVNFSQRTNLIYGAGGFSGILAGLVATRAINQRFCDSPENIAQIYGVSAGVLNGFFHAIQIAAFRYPDIYKPAAKNALIDLDDFISNITRAKIARYNLNPVDFWQGWANLGPLEVFLKERLSAYTGSAFPDQIYFKDIGLPLTIAAARGDGFTDFLGMTQPIRKMEFSGHSIQIFDSPIIKSILAGWSMNTYIQPTALNGELYRDGGGPYYDIGLFVACLDERLTNMINIHLDEPESHTYNLPARPNLLRILFDTHNFYFPEERRRMFTLTNLLYKHFQLREEYWIRSTGILGAPDLEPDFRQEWIIEDKLFGEQG